MSIAEEIGVRLRRYRKEKGWSQEELGERADLHYTYIGQIERGEKNATIDSISKIAAALDISLSQLFENIDLQMAAPNIPAQCYGLIQAQPVAEQQILHQILLDLIKYRNC